MQDLLHEFFENTTEKLNNRRPNVILISKQSLKYFMANDIMCSFVFWKSVDVSERLIDESESNAPSQRSLHQEYGSLVEKIHKRFGERVATINLRDDG